MIANFLALVKNQYILYTHYYCSLVKLFNGLDGFNLADSFTRAKLLNMFKRMQDGNTDLKR